MSKSIFIGDHVWIGQNALILKGCRIGSGSIVSAAAVLAGKVVQSNSIYAGNPARMIKNNVFFIGRSVHNYTKKKSERSMQSEIKDFIYHEPVERFDFDSVNESLTNAANARERLDLVRTQIASQTGKDRFYIPGARKKPGLFSGRK